MTIQCDHVIETTRPDNVVVEKENNKAIIVDIITRRDCIRKECWTWNRKRLTISLYNNRRHGRRVQDIP